MDQKRQRGNNIKCSGCKQTIQARKACSASGRADVLEKRTHHEWNLGSLGMRRYVHNLLHRTFMNGAGSHEISKNMKGKYTLTKSPCETFVGSGFRRHQLEVDNLISFFARFEKMSSASIFFENSKSINTKKKRRLPSVDDTGLVQVKGIELQTHFGQILGVDWPTGLRMDGSPVGFGVVPWRLETNPDIYWYYIAAKVMKLSVKHAVFLRLHLSPGKEKKTLVRSIPIDQTSFQKLL